MRMLGIDFGLSKIGLAMSEGNFASPLLVISSIKWQNKILKVIEDQKIEKIIIGISEGKTGEETKKFVNELGRLTDKKIETFDETLTTQDAISKMIAAGKSRKFRKEHQDAVAASLILQSYIDSTKEVSY